MVGMGTVNVEIISGDYLMSLFSIHPNLTYSRDHNTCILYLYANIKDQGDQIRAWSICYPVLILALPENDLRNILSKREKQIKLNSN